MKRLLAPLLAVLPLLALAEPKLYVTTGKFAHGCGEEMAFSIRAVDGGADVEADVAWKLDADDGRETGRGDGKTAPGAPLVVKTSLAQPGFVRLTATFADGTKGRFIAGAAAEPEKLRGVPEPEDFDEFWAKQRAIVDGVDLSTAVLADAPAEVAEKRKGYRVRSVTIPLPGGLAPATAWVVVPEGAAPKSVKFIKAQFEGYGFGGRDAPGGEKESIVLKINAHGFELGREDAYYKEFAESVKSNGQGYALDLEQNASPETSYFRGMILRDLLVLRWAETSLPEYMGWGVFVQGGSQGGFQSIAMAALDRKVITCMPAFPWMCDVGGFVVLGRMKSTFQPAYTPALRYFDSVNFAKRISTGVIVAPAGLGDYVCPPSGLAVLYNALGEKAKSRSIHWVQGAEHVQWRNDTESFDLKEKK